MNIWHITVTGSTMDEIRQAAEGEYRRFFGYEPKVILRYFITGTTETTTVRDGAGDSMYESSETIYTAEVSI